MPTPENPFPPPEPGLDAAVRAQLDAEAARTNPQAAWENVLARLNADPPPPTTPASPTRRRRLGAAAALAATAAAVLVAWAFWPGPRLASASPSEVIREARTAHAAGPDRCYSVAIDFPQPLKGLFPLLADDARPNRVWTRGDEFVVVPGFTGRGAWGRDASGRVWVAPSREAAARFTADELPQKLKEAVAVRGMELDTLLGDLLADYDLAWGEDPSPAGDLDHITATPRRSVGVLGVVSADLAVDKTTRTVRVLTLRRKFVNDAVVTFTFTLRTTADPPPAYTAEGHLQPNAPVHDADAPVLRRRVLLQVIGEIPPDGL